MAEAVAENPTAATLHLKLGDAYEESQRYDLAMAQWRMVLDLEPDHASRLKLLNLIEKYTSNVPLSVDSNPPVPPKPAAQPSTRQ